MRAPLSADRRALPFLAGLCAFGWSLPYPLIKLSYASFGIASDDLGSVILFAGLRFFAAGLLLGLLCLARRERLAVPSPGDGAFLVAFALVNTSLRYLATYIGLSHLASSRSTILDSLANFLAILFSCLVYADDRMSVRKAAGCLLGLGGIVLATGTGGGAGFSWAGDGMMLLDALAGGIGGVMTRRVGRRMAVVPATAVSMAFGGAVLAAAGLLVGVSSPWHVDAQGLGLLLVLSLISATCFGIYNSLLAHHPLSKVAIFNAAIPVLSVCNAHFLLGERLAPRYLFAGMAVAFGVWLVNSRGRNAA